MMGALAHGVCFFGWMAGRSYARIVHNLTAAGVIQTSKELCWDVRPNPEFGTVEIRMCDMLARPQRGLGNRGR